jgi:hypothetical protein
MEGQTIGEGQRRQDDLERIQLVRQHRRTADRHQRARLGRGDHGGAVKDPISMDVIEVLVGVDHEADRAPGWTIAAQAPVPTCSSRK